MEEAQGLEKGAHVLSERRSRRERTQDGETREAQSRAGQTHRMGACSINWKALTTPGYLGENSWKERHWPTVLEGRTGCVLLSSNRTQETKQRGGQKKLKGVTSAKCVLILGRGREERPGVDFRLKSSLEPTSSDV